MVVTVTENFKTMFKLFKKTHPIKGYSYAVTTGAYVGEMFVFIEEKEEDYKFISIPKNVNRDVPKDKFILGMNEGIVEVVEKLPRKISSLLEKQYRFNQKTAK